MPSSLYSKRTTATDASSSNLIAAYAFVAVSTRKLRASRAALRSFNCSGRSSTHNTMEEHMATSPLNGARLSRRQNRHHSQAPVGVKKMLAPAECKHL